MGLSESITQYRKHTFRLSPDRRIDRLSQVAEFVNERGFTLFWPAQGMVMPTLWNAVAGDRPVPNNHDDPAHITWRWKDQTLGLKKWYYAKFLRRKATFISLETIPYFYALSENYGSPEDDYLIDFHDGKLSFEEKVIYESILDKGPLHTIELKSLLRQSARANEGSFSRSLEKLQAGIKILPVGIAEAGSWKYAYIYDLTSRHFPNLSEQARVISQDDARLRILELYFLSVGYASQHDVLHVFGWEKDQIIKTLGSLQMKGFIKYINASRKPTDPEYILTGLSST